MVVDVVKKSLDEKWLLQIRAPSKMSRDLRSRVASHNRLITSFFGNSKNLLGDLSSDELIALSRSSQPGTTQEAVRLMSNHCKRDMELSQCYQK